MSERRVGLSSIRAFGQQLRARGGRLFGRRRLASGVAAAAAVSGLLTAAGVTLPAEVDPTTSSSIAGADQGRALVDPGVPGQASEQRSIRDEFADSFTPGVIPEEELPGDIKLRP